MALKKLSYLLVFALLAAVTTPLVAEAGRRSTTHLSGVQIATSGSFENKVLRANVPVLVFVTADWCPVCQSTAPEVAKFAQRNTASLTVVALNDDDNSVLTRRLGVRSLPTFLYYENGKIVTRKSAGYDMDELQSWLKPYFEKFTRASSSY